MAGTGYNNGKAHSDRVQSPADYSTESLQPLSDEHRDFIQKSLDAWCANSGYKDCTVNMLTLSRTLSIPKGELSAYFDQYLKTTFRIWLGDIRFNAAKKMMQEYPDYSNDIISAECGFSARTYLYRIFKLKEGCTPTEWREKMAENHSY
ncbi:helix-turn-helix domain-containing protein [Prevotella copri]|uniref:Helix-turn-helix domain-containing protein n=1 Tax=Segatella copri TaxID=165179 RepID=A0AAW4N9J3_9BACT|nr:helix-turn-helix domain-containing protein [Segatella copri]MBV3396047.1 helix-turn-helix domain-containing protein [Segatella copri]MBV3405699.1 helix-turn-helix domain-containing protein [Segatella copri]